MLSHTSQSLSSASPVELSEVPNLKKRQELPAMLSGAPTGESKKEGKGLSQLLTDESQAPTTFSALLLKEVEKQTTEVRTFDGEIQPEEAKLASAVDLVLDVEGKDLKQEHLTTQPENAVFGGSKVKAFDQNSQQALEEGLPFTSQIQTINSIELNTADVENGVTKKDQNASDLANNDGGLVEGGQEPIQPLVAGASLVGQEKTTLETKFNEDNYEGKSAEIKSDEQNRTGLENGEEASLAGQEKTTLETKFNEDNYEDNYEGKSAEIKSDEQNRTGLENGEEAFLAGLEKTTLETKFNEDNYEGKSAEIKSDEENRTGLENGEEAFLAGQEKTTLETKFNEGTHDGKAAEIKLDAPSEEASVQFSYTVSQAESGAIKTAETLKGQVQGAHLNQSVSKQKGENIANASKQSDEATPFADDIDVEDDPILKGGIGASLASIKTPVTGHTTAFHAASATQGAVGSQTANFIEQMQRQQTVLKHQATVKESDLTATVPSDGGVLKGVDGGVVATDKAASAPMQFASITHSISSQKWGEALGKHLIVAANKSMQKMQIMLNPEKLGPIQVQLHLNKDKQLHVALSANHVLTREAMMEAMPRLREMLESNGVQLASMDVSDKGFNGEQQQGGQSLKETGQKAHGQMAEESLTTEDELIQTRVGLNRNEGMINYYA
jgi:flagellar hook-length control protein FliK